MAEQNDYTSGLNILLGQATQPMPAPQDPGQEIANLYDNQMDATPEEEQVQVPSGLSGLIENSNQGLTPQDQQLFESYVSQRAAQADLQDQYAGFNRMAEVPNQQMITDPNAMIGSTGE